MSLGLSLGRAALEKGTCCKLPGPDKNLYISSTLTFNRQADLPQQEHCLCVKMAG